MSCISGRAISPKALRQRHPDTNGEVRWPWLRNGGGTHRCPSIPHQGSLTERHRVSKRLTMYAYVKSGSPRRNFLGALELSESTGDGLPLGMKDKMV